MVDAVANQPNSLNGNTFKLDRFKIADPQYIISTDPAATIEEMQNTLWQNIGGHEIISLARRDLVSGKRISYQIIADLQKLDSEYSPKSIISIENSSPFYFNNFGIKFEKYLPSEDALQTVDPNLSNPITINANNDITIYVSNIKDSYEVEVQSIASEELLRDTIY
jgi:hypothetical protein